MPLFEFACPHCSQPFALVDPAAGQAVACPHCGAEMALPAELPPPVDDGTEALDMGEPAEASSGIEDSAAVLPFDVYAPIERAAGRDARLASQAIATSPVRRLSREEKDRRRARRNLTMMLVGITVLALAAMILSRL